MLSAALLCLALNVYHEARGEPIKGQIAVAQVVMNRAKGADKPACHVVTERGQFSWVDGTYKHLRRMPDEFEIAVHAHDLRKYRVRDIEAWKRSVEIADDVYSERVADPTRGAKFFHATRVSPSWRNYKVTYRIGRHVFYKGNT